MIAAMAVDGVLRRRVGPEHKLSLIMSGGTLFNALRSAYDIALLAQEANPAQLGQWLQINGVAGWTKMITDPEIEEPVDALMRQLQRLRNQTPVDLCIVADPLMATRVMAAGIPTLLFCHVAYMRPEYRPWAGGSVRPWDELVQEINEQKLLSAQAVNATFEEYEPH